MQHCRTRLETQIENRAEYRLHGGTEYRLLTSAAELREALQELFKLVLPHAPELDAVLARVVPGSTVR